MNRHISTDTIDDLFQELEETEVVRMLAEQKMAKYALFTGTPRKAACEDNHGASQKAKA